ncbi:hypothetical protein TL16_g01806 [Triparma laevis f. inornata]|uniref:Uncharacterized protein n=1 Tax=Triparma laevis f. inornata TaxID=1714386 RepID=A0A9W6ZMN5_9STRA|nr:hypothetical protein TL16_g01806 [Triparma laevis f. inornata]
MAADDFGSSVDYVQKVLLKTDKFAAPIPYRLAKLADTSRGDLSDLVSSSFLESSSKWRQKQRLASELEHLVSDPNTEMTSAKRSHLSRMIESFHTKPVLSKLQSAQQEAIKNRGRNEMAVNLAKFKDGEHQWKDTQMKDIVKRLHTSDRTKRTETESRSLLHPFTKAPTITASTGPAAPPHMRLENDEKIKSGMTEDEPANFTVHFPETSSPSSPSSPASPSDSPEPQLPILQEEKILPQGSAVSVALSLRNQSHPPPPNPLLEHDLLQTLPPEQLLHFLTHGRAQTAPSNNNKYKIPEGVRFEDDKQPKKIVDVEIKPDPLFAALMGKDAELSARPKTTAALPSKNSSKIINAAMPSIQMQMRTKIDVTLNSIGHVRPVKSDFVSLFEEDDTESNLYPLQLTTVGKCKYDDPCPLMPSAIPPLFLTRNDEPVRDRDKVWRLDSERKILGTEIDVTVGRIHQEFVANRNAILRGEEYDYKFPLKMGQYPNGGTDSRENVYSDEAGSLISRERQWRGACLISRTYCILTAYGMGIAGRVHAAGLHIPRYILLEAYSKEGSATHQVWVTMDMLEKLFDDRPELLKPGQKKTMIFELCKMCFFEYEVYEQWTNDGIDGREMELTPVNPPKVTKYRHNEKWHIDQLEEEIDSDNDDEEDEKKPSAKDLALALKAKKKEARRATKLAKSLKKKQQASPPKVAEIKEEESLESLNISLESNQDATIEEEGVEKEKKGEQDEKELPASPTSPKSPTGEPTEEEGQEQEKQVFSTKKTRKSIRKMKRSPHAKTTSPERNGSSPERNRTDSSSSPSKSPLNANQTLPSGRRGSNHQQDFPTEPGTRTSVWQKKKVWIVEYLKISKGKKMSAAEVRRDELRKKRAKEAQASEMARKKWMATPKRMRGLTIGCTIRIDGFMLTAMVYEFKQNPGVYKIKLFDILGAGGCYEIKLSSSVVAKQLGIKRKATKWTREQKRDLLTKWLRATRENDLLPPKGGRPEVEHVYEEVSASMKSRVVWNQVGRIGVNGTHLKMTPARFPKRRKDFVQVPMNVTGPLLATDPMSWEKHEFKGGEVVRVRDMRHPYKKKGKTVVLDDKPEQPLLGRPDTRELKTPPMTAEEGGKAARKTKSGKKEKGEEKKEEKKSRESRKSRGKNKDRPKSKEGSRPGSRSKSREGRPNSRSKSREKRREARKTKDPSFLNKYEEDPEEVAAAKREAENVAKVEAAAAEMKEAQRLQEVEEQKVALRVAEAKAKKEEEERLAEEERRNPKFVAFAKSLKDFMTVRGGGDRPYSLGPSENSGVVDFVNGSGEVKAEEKYFLSSAHANAYCPRRFFQPTTAMLGASFHKNPERRGRPVFRVGCKPRREVGRGKRMVSGGAKVDDLRGIYEIYRAGPGNSWSSNDGSGEAIKFFFTVVSEIEVTSRYHRKLLTGDTFCLDLTIDDLFRCCRGTEHMDLAMLGDDEYLKQEKESQGEQAKALKLQEEEALETCKKELAKAKKLAAKVRLARKDKCEADFRKVKAFVKKEREVMRTVIKRYVEAAEKAWKDVALMLIKKCEWFEQSDDSRDMMYVNGKLEKNIVGLPCLVGKKVVGGKVKLKEGEEEVTSHFDLKLDCKIYQGVKRINSRSKYRDGYRTLLFMVSQERLSLRFIAYDFETSDYFIFSYGEIEQQETVKVMREISEEEVQFQFNQALLGANYEDNGTYPGSKKRTFVVKFENEMETAGNVQVHMSEEEEKKAAAQLDSMLRASSSRAKSREHAAEAKVKDVEEDKWGLVYDSDGEE